MSGHRGSARRSINLLRLIGPMAMLALGVGLLAPSALGSAVTGERWEGTWRYENEFGEGTMNLCEKDGFVFGVFGNAEGGGKIWGNLLNRRTRWSGKYRNSTGNTNKAPFYAIFDTGATFTGAFKACGYLRCGPWHEWSGERLDRDSDGNAC